MLVFCRRQLSGTDVGMFVEDLARAMPAAIMATMDGPGGRAERPPVCAWWELRTSPVDLS